MNGREKVWLAAENREALVIVRKAIEHRERGKEWDGKDFETPEEKILRPLSHARYHSKAIWSDGGSTGWVGRRELWGNSRDWHHSAPKRSLDVELNTNERLKLKDLASGRVVGLGKGAFVGIARTIRTVQGEFREMCRSRQKISSGDGLWVENDRNRCPEFRSTGQEVESGNNDDRARHFNQKLKIKTPPGKFEFAIEYGVKCGEIRRDGLRRQESNGTEARNHTDGFSDRHWGHEMLTLG